MHSELFKMIVDKQLEWRRRYNSNKKTTQIIRTICNRKYKSKGNKELKEIHKSLLDLGFLEEVKLDEREFGNLCDSSITIEHSSSNERESILEQQPI